MTKLPLGSMRECFKSLISSARVLYLRSGLFCVHLMMISSKLCGSSGAYWDGGTISSWRCLIAIATVVSPSKGTLPVTISYMVIPKE